jgi:hypothetical protein
MDKKYLKESILIEISNIYLLTKRLNVLSTEYSDKLSISLNNPPEIMDDEIYKELVAASESTGRNIFDLVKEDIDKLRVYFEYLIRSVGRSQIQEQISLFKSTYPTMIVSSMILLVFSNLEKNLNKICESFAEDINIRLRVSELGGRSIFEKFKIYFTKVIDFRINWEDIKSWDELLHQKNIRNIIVHNGGKLESESIRRSTYDYIYSREDIRVSKDNFLIISYNFFDHIIDTIEKFINSFFELTINGKN